MLVFAYDGSLNGDWIAHYAVRFAASRTERRLRLVHLHEASLGSALDERLARIRNECGLAGVTLEVELVARRSSDVAEQLLSLAPPGSTLVVGTRARARGSALLAGTVSARMMELGRFPVIAIRVVQPGVLGRPGTVLLPVSGDDRELRDALGLLRLLGPDLHRLHVLLLRQVSRVRLRFSTPEVTGRLLAEGRPVLARLEEQLREGLLPERPELDSSTVVCDDGPREILLGASRHHSRLVCFGLPSGARVTRRAPVERILRATPSDVAIYGRLE